MVSVKIDFRKKDFVWISLVIVLIGVGVVVAAWDSNKAMFHDSDDVKVTIDSVDYSLQEALDGGLIGGGMKFGTWVDLGTSALSNQGPATSDGFILAYKDENANQLKGFTGQSGDLEMVVKNYNRNYANHGSITMPVKKGEYWTVEGADQIYWMPIVSGGGGSGGDVVVKSVRTTGAACNSITYIDCDSGYSPISCAIKKTNAVSTTTDVPTCKVSSMSRCEFEVESNGGCDDSTIVSQCTCMDVNSVQHSGTF